MPVHLHVLNPRMLHCGTHVRRLHAAALDFPHIDRMNPIDEVAVPLALGIEVGSVTSVHKDIDDVLYQAYLYIQLNKICKFPFNKKWPQIRTKYTKILYDIL